VREQTILDAADELVGQLGDPVSRSAADRVRFAERLVGRGQQARAAQAIAGEADDTAVQHATFVRLRRVRHGLERDAIGAEEPYTRLHGDRVEDALGLRIESHARSP
jgi:hypothetical protein